MSVKVICKTLSCLSNNVNVHAVGANANGATKTSGAKSKRTIKRVVQLVFCFWFDKLIKLFYQVFFGDVCTPGLKCFHNFCIHKDSQTSNSSLYFFVKDTTRILS